MLATSFSADFPSECSHILISVFPGLLSREQVGVAQTLVSPAHLRVAHVLIRNRKGRGDHSDTEVTSVIKTDFVI